MLLCDCICACLVFVYLCLPCVCVFFFCNKVSTFQQQVLTNTCVLRHCLRSCVRARVRECVWFCLFIFRVVVIVILPVMCWSMRGGGKIVGTWSVWSRCWGGGKTRHLCSCLILFCWCFTLFFAWLLFVFVRLYFVCVRVSCVFVCLYYCALVLILFVCVFYFLCWSWGGGKVVGTCLLFDRAIFSLISFHFHLYFTTCSSGQTPIMVFGCKHVLWGVPGYLLDMFMSSWQHTSTFCNHALTRLALAVVFAHQFSRCVALTTWISDALRRHVSFSRIMHAQLCI